jgi:hypothetical protein
MKRFYETYSGLEKLAPFVREISWTKNIVIMEMGKVDWHPDIEISHS